jgi:hypothetical protein
MRMGCLVLRSSFPTYDRCIGDLLLVVTATELLLLCATWDVQYKTTTSFIVQTYIPLYNNSITAAVSGV